MNHFHILISALLFVFSLLMSGTSSAKGSKSYSCPYQNEEIGAIKGFGPTKKQAFIDATDKCFDRHVSNFRNVRGSESSEDRKLMYIDICANITCG